ncbi:MAG: hypothetical protein F6K28_57350 [Microcoleus sp. SIO2G3]|nr:hypothetical protein [Microcoleus sp. SIO2G3]
MRIGQVKSMDGLVLGLAIAVVVASGVGIGLWAFFTVFLGRMRTAGEQRMHDRFTDDQILRAEPTANFLGLESRGSGQVRGNGVLVLTRDELWFSRFVMREDLRIPLETIREVRLVEAHLGKRILGRKLVYVQFQTPQGIDAAAWLVADPNSWKMAIESSIQSKTS